MLKKVYDIDIIKLVVFDLMLCFWQIVWIHIETQCSSSYQIVFFISTKQASNYRKYKKEALFLTTFWIFSTFVFDNTDRLRSKAVLQSKRSSRKLLCYLYDSQSIKINLYKSYIMELSLTLPTWITHSFFQAFRPFSCFYKYLLSTMSISKPVSISSFWVTYQMKEVIFPSFWFL